MASVNFKKVKGASDAKAHLRHNDKEERRVHNHSNIDIDKSKINQDINLTGLSYKQKCKRYDDRIKELDSTTNKNKRCDRVTMFLLELPAPLNMSREDSNNFFKDVTDYIARKYGKENIISAEIHNDEKHFYYDKDKKDIVESRDHLHIAVIPALDGKLNGKKFSSPRAMSALNKELDALCREKYHMPMMTGEEPRHNSVEKLKRASQSAIDENLDFQNALEENINQKGKELDKLNENYNALDDKYSEKKEKMNNDLQKEYEEKKAKQTKDLKTYFNEQKADLDEQLERLVNTLNEDYDKKLEEYDLKNTDLQRVITIHNQYPDDFDLLLHSAELESKIDKLKEQNIKKDKKIKEICTPEQQKAIFETDNIEKEI